MKMGREVKDINNAFEERWLVHSSQLCLTSNLRTATCSNLCEISLAECGEVAEQCVAVIGVLTRCVALNWLNPWWMTQIKPNKIIRERSSHFRKSILQKPFTETRSLKSYSHKPVCYWFQNSFKTYFP